MGTSTRGNDAQTDAPGNDRGGGRAASVFLGVPTAASAGQLPHPSPDPVAVSPSKLGSVALDDAFPIPADPAELPPLPMLQDEVSAATADAPRAAPSGAPELAPDARLAPVPSTRDAADPLADVTVTVSTDGTEWIDPGQVTVYAVRAQDAYWAEFGTHTSLGDFSATLWAAEYQFYTYYEGPANLVSPPMVLMTLEAGQSYHIDLVLRRGATISGTLVTERGTPVDQPRIALGQLTWGVPSLSPTTFEYGVDGSFTISRVYAGDYDFYFDSSAAVPAVVGEFWQNTRDMTAVTHVHVDDQADVTGIDVVLDDVNSLRGVVRTKNAHGDLVPAANVEITAAGYSGGVWHTDANGEFDAYGFQDGTYAFQFGAAPGGTKWGTVITDPVTFAGGTMVIDDYDLEIAIGGDIAGTIRYVEHDGDAPQPGAGIVVQASRLDPDTGAYQPIATAVGPAYRLPNLAPGQYLLHFVDQWSRDVRDEYWDDTPYKSEATLVTVTSGATTAGIDATLDPWLVWLWQYGGADRYAVAQNISEAAFAPGVPVVYIASGEKYPDALSAGPAAARQNGALLLVAQNQIPQATRDGIAHLQPQKIVVVGGTASVSAAVFDLLKKLQPNITRVGGADRYEVSRNVIDYAFCGGSSGECAGGAKTVITATGANFPDALSAGPAAAHVDGAVLLLPGGSDDVDAPTRALLGRLGTTTVYIAGGPASVGYPIEQALDVMLPGAVERLSGADRFEASANINSRIFGSGETAFIASGLGFADALSGGPSAATVDAPLYLVQKECWPASVWSQITTHYEPVDLILLGGPNTLGTGVSNVERLC